MKMKRRFFALVLVVGVVLGVLGLFVFEVPPSRYVVEAEQLNDSEQCDRDLQSLSTLPERDREVAREAITNGSTESVRGVDACVEYQESRYTVGPAIAIDTFPPDWHRWVDAAAAVCISVGLAGLALSRRSVGDGE